MMVLTDKFCLKWDDFKENVSTVFQNLLQDRDFSDVTLVSEEGEQILAHKIILSSCSPVLRQILKENLNVNPLIYMRGIKTKYLIAIIEFVYNGKVEIYGEDINEFMVISEDLKLKGLTRECNKSDDKISDMGDPESRIEALDQQMSSMMKIFKKPASNQSESFGSTNKLNDDEDVKDNININVKTEPLRNDDIDDPLTVTNIKSNEQILDKQIMRMVIKHADGWQCSKCEKTSNSKSHLKAHIESMHIEGGLHPCQQCGKLMKTRESLRQHTRLMH